MLQIKRLILFLFGFLFILSSQILHAEDKSYQDLIKLFNTSKTEVFKQAEAEGKYIFLFAGRIGCKKCIETLESINAESNKSILEKEYVLWYIDWDKVSNTTNLTIEGKNYVEEAKRKGIEDLPALFIINPYEPEESVSFVSGWNNEKEINTLLTSQGRPVSNEMIETTSVNISLSGNLLYISNNILCETVSIYTITGQKVTSFAKETTETVNAKILPKGILIIKSSAGWNTKILNK
ncbi:T9SS type A sorting domain-containing protein [Massilibacteroides sp.]|uniref:T9SS type A sorting domain-containing protein n=1 Tax=Massilibacteroides sp. TaxID=2034766 RepID=UPI0026256FCC|nr:T9SS type A sorting domain-containing protein [Massilibacteroides sp.]MDD4515284.1 T9SS type A sorting domain-containing protein [Massilibacteroides sp.]